MSREVVITTSEKLNFGNFRVLPEIEDMASLSKYSKENNLLEVEIEAIKKGIESLAGEPEKFRLKPKIHFDLAKNEAQVISWPVYLATREISSRFNPSGISIGVVSKDSCVVGIQRSQKNNTCKGFLGTPADYMLLPYNDFQTRDLPKEVNLEEQIQKNVIDQMSHELNLKKKEYGYYIYGLSRVDYPEKQDEFIVLAYANLRGEEIKQRALKNKGTETGLAENRVILLNKDDISNLVSKDIPTATQHIVALSLAGGLDIEPIKGLSRPNPKEAFEKDIASMLT